MAAFRQLYLALLRDRTPGARRRIERAFNGAINRGLEASGDPEGQAQEIEAVLRATLPGALRGGLLEPAQTWATVTARHVHGLVKQEEEELLDREVRTEIANALEAHVLVASNEVVANRVGPLLELLTEAAAEGISNAEIVKRLKTSGDLGDVAAWRIARTEMAAGLNSASLTAAEHVAEDEPLRKVWTSSGLSNVRPAHRRANGQKRESRDWFIVAGDRLQFPGDRSGGAKAGNVINCNCGLTYAV